MSTTWRHAQASARTTEEDTAHAWIKLPKITNEDSYQPQNLVDLGIMASLLMHISGHPPTKLESDRYMRNIVENLRRSSLPLQITTVAAAIILTALMGYQIKHAKSSEEAATVVFTVTHSPAQVNASFDSVQSLTTTGAVMVQTLMSQDSHAIARQAGGTATFNAELVNYYNEDYPEYEYPFVTLVVQGPALAGVQATFKVVVGMLRNMLSNRQAQAGVPKAQRINFAVIDDTGAFVEEPSRVRSYAALCVLSAVVTSMSLIFIRRLLPRGHPRSFSSCHGAVRGPGHRGIRGKAAFNAESRG